MTSQQYKVLKFIENHISTKGFPPTMREIALHLGSPFTGGPVCHVKALIKQGYLTKKDRLPRTIALTGKPITKSITKSITKQKRKK